ncbi:hypothetical protein ACS0TY_010878 [Phlomoides rotata]
MDHLFSFCPWTRLIISKVSCVFNVNLHFELGFGHWFLQAVQRTFSPQVTALWRLCIVTIVWVIWDQRNKRTFEGSYAMGFFFACHLLGIIREAGEGINAAMRNSMEDLVILSACGVKGRPPRAPNIRCVRWQVPPINVIKINIDGGAAGSPGLLTGGEVFRDNFGVFRGCFAVSHGRGFAFEAELATTLFSIELAHDKGWNTIWLESDSTYVVHILKSIDRVRRLRSGLNMVVSHIYREGNAVADRLTREVVDKFQWWSVPPLFLVPFLQRDLVSDFYRFLSL